MVNMIRMTTSKSLVLCAVVCAPLAAQMPAGWQSEEVLGTGVPQGQMWWGGGLWTADKHGPAATLVQSLGMGNALTGSGLSLEGGLKPGSWDFGGRVLLYKNGDGNSSVSAYEGHALYRSKGGWVTGLEREPLVWGYGLNGGYLLGEAARPFPRFRVESPFKNLSFFHIPLGSWKGQFFVGKMEFRRIVSEDVQDPSYRVRAVGQYGEPEGPLLSGFRAEAHFGDAVEFYANWINLFGGTLNGTGMMDGYGFKDYLTAFSGTKDAQAEAQLDMQDFTHFQPNQVKAKSASNADVGVRVRMSFLEKALGAEGVHFYITRGSKAVNINYDVAWHRPLYYLGKDLSGTWPPGRAWGRTYWYYAPAAQVPNDVVGLLLDWHGVRLGLEYLDTVNTKNQFDNRPVQNGHRSFTHYVYRSGFYYYGDPLGSGLGGEARYSTIRLEWDAADRFTLQTWLQGGQRPFRDVVEDWVLDHPGETPVDTQFLGIQQGIRWQVDSHLHVRAGYSWQHQRAVEYQEGVTGNGFRWYVDAGWRWSR
jgi:hypothetical protein